MTSQEKIYKAVELLREVSEKIDRGQFFNSYPETLMSFDELIEEINSIEVHDDIDKQ